MENLNKYNCPGVPDRSPQTYIIRTSDRTCHFETTYRAQSEEVGIEEFSSGKSILLGGRRSQTAVDQPLSKERDAGGGDWTRSNHCRREGLTRRPEIDGERRGTSDGVRGTLYWGMSRWRDVDEQKTRRALELINIDRLRIWSLK